MTADKEFPYLKRDLIEELQKSNKLIGALITATENKEKIYRDFTTELKDQVKDHHETLYGNPKENKNGLVQNVQIIMESGAKKEKYLKWGLGGVVVAAGSSIWNMIVEGLRHLR